MTHPRPCRIVSCGLLVIVACAKNSGPTLEDKERAARQQEEATMRSHGAAPIIKFRGDHKEILVYENLRVGGNSLCDAAFWPAALTPATPNQAAPFNADPLLRLGIKRVECEGGTGVFGEDLPYVVK